MSQPPGKCFSCQAISRIEELERERDEANALIDRAILWVAVNPDMVHDLQFDDILEDMRKAREVK